MDAHTQTGRQIKQIWRTKAVNKDYQRETKERKAKRGHNSHQTCEKRRQNEEANTATGRKGEGKQKDTREQGGGHSKPGSREYLSCIENPKSKLFGAKT